MVNATTTQSFFSAMDVGATTAYVTTDSPAQTERARQQLRHALGPLATIRTVSDVAASTRATASGFDTFFRIMGLVAVVIGGIGIINTMLVAARRRTREIAVLKALGMKGRQVIAVFTIEAIILALVGAVGGVVGGIAISVVVNRATESLAGYPIPWSLQAAPLIAGTGVGVVATVLFSYLPVLRASRARPVAALRNEHETSRVRGRARLALSAAIHHPLPTIWHALRATPRGVIHLPQRQGLRTFVCLLTVACVMGTLSVVYAGLAGGTKAPIMGSMIGLGTLLGVGVVTQLFVVIVWIISKMPSFGRLSLRMALRNMGTQKRRLASTILALTVGILAVGSIAILAQNLRNSISQAAEKQLQFNVAVESPWNPATNRAIDARVTRLSGVEHVYRGSIATAAMPVSANGHTTSAILLRKAHHGISTDTISEAVNDLRGVEGRDVRRSSYNLTMTAGRNLNPSDAGTDHLLMSQRYADLLDVKVGSKIVFADGPKRVPFTVIGLYDSSSWLIFAHNIADERYLRHVGLTDPSGSHYRLLYLQVKKSAVASDIATLRHTAHGSLVLDLSNFLVMINKAVDKLSLFPEIIAALSLFAGVVIIANTVALAMLERRRELGVFKALGARRRTILQFLLLENAIVGLIGAGAGVLLAMLATVLVDSAVLKIHSSFDLLTVAALVLLGVGLAVGASALTAFPASSDKPMSILRHE